MYFNSAEKQFAENFKLFTNASTNPKEFNLYAGLANMAKGLSQLENRIAEIENRLNRIEQNQIRRS